MARQTRWDLALGLAGAVYLTLVLFMGIEAPVLGVALLALAGYALVRPHRTNSRRNAKQAYQPLPQNVRKNRPQADVAGGTACPTSESAGLVVAAQAVPPADLGFFPASHGRGSAQSEP